MNNDHQIRSGIAKALGQCSLTSYIVKWALVSCYKYRGLDHKKVDSQVSNGSFITSENYSIRQNAHHWPDIVITENGIQVYYYFTGHSGLVQYKSTPLMSLREFLKKSQHDQIERTPHPESRAKKMEVTMDYMLAMKRHEQDDPTGVKPKLDQIRWQAADDENARWNRKRIAYIDEYIDHSLRIQLACWIVGL